MSVNRPNFSAAWHLFSQINVDVAEVGNKIGGKIKANTDSGIFQNACPIRMSYALNRCGVLIPNNGKYAVVSGSDKKWYMYRVNDMIAFLRITFGEPDFTAASPTTKTFAGKKGIIVFLGSGWSNARGHVTLWSGTVCSDTCHFMGDPENGPFVPDSASLWSLS